MRKVENQTIQMLRVVRSNIVESFPAYSLKDFLKNLFASSPWGSATLRKICSFLVSVSKVFLIAIRRASLLRR
jgi:hypothetical protein